FRGIGGADDRCRTDGSSIGYVELVEGERRGRGCKAKQAALFQKFELGPGPSIPSGLVRTFQPRYCERLSGIVLCFRDQELACHGKTSAAKSQFPPHSASERDAPSLKA